MSDLERCESLHSVRLLRELVQHWFGLPVLFADASGLPLEHAKGRVISAPNEVCRSALFSRSGFASCNESYRAMCGCANRVAQSASPSIREDSCHMGFEVVAAPVRAGESFLGSMFVSGFVGERLREADRSRLCDCVRQIDPGATDFEPLLASVRVVEPARRADLALMLSTTAADVSRFLSERARTLHPPAPQFEGIIGSSAPMQALFRMLEKVVQSESTVLVLGESGTGKELVARAIHDRGPRKKKPFVAQNCSAITDTLLESAMFGYIRGSFTGAVKDTKGLFDVADGGSFFLDEIGDMSPALQVKLLRVLQDGTFTPVGGTSERRVDVRVIAATNKDLATAVQRGEFREDLYYRLNVIRLMMPPLRDRGEDISTLIDFFLDHHNKARAGNPLRLSGEVRRALEEHDWPGNVRELENEIERLSVLANDYGEVGPDLLSPRLQEHGRERPSHPPAFRTAPGGSLRQTLEDVERQIIREGLERTGGNKSQLAKELGISRSNLIAKVQQYGLEKQAV